MTIAYPASPPVITAATPIEVVWTRHSGVTSSQSAYTGVQQTYPHALQLWQVDVTLPALNRQKFQPWDWFISSLNCQEGAFWWTDYLAPAPLGAAAGAPVVNGAGQAGKSISTRNWGANNTQVLLPGDKIQIGNHLHITGGATTDGSGNAVIDIWPNARNYADGTSVIYTAPQCLMKLIGSTTAHKENTDHMYELSFQAMEVCP